MKAKKSFRMLATRQFPDNTHLSFCFETELERDIDNEEQLKDLADVVYKSTCGEALRRFKSDPGVEAVWKNLARQLKLEKKRDA